MRNNSSTNSHGCETKLQLLTQQQQVLIAIVVNPPATLAQQLRVRNGKCHHLAVVPLNVNV